MSHNSNSPGELGNTTPAGSGYGAAVERGDMLAILMGLQSAVGELKGDVRHLTTAVDGLKTSQNALPDIFADKLEKAVGKVASETQKKVGGLEKKVEKLALWKAAILGGAAVLTFLGGLTAYAIHEFKDSIQLVPTHSESTSTEAATAAQATPSPAAAPAEAQGRSATPPKGK